MDKKQEEFLKRLRLTFRTEAEEHLQAMSSGLIDLEKKQSAEEQTVIIEIIFREAHSLKGAARAVNLTDIEEICQPLESIFKAMKNQEIDLTAELFDNLHHALDTISKILSTPETVQASEISELIQLLDQIKTGEPDIRNQLEGYASLLHQDILTHPQEKVELKEEKTGKEQRGNLPVSETIRISTDKLDHLLLQTEEMLSVKLTTSQYAAELKDVRSMFALWWKEWGKLSTELRNLRQILEQKKNGKGIKQYANLLEFIDWNHTFIKSIEADVTKMAKSAEHDKRSLGGMVDNLLEDMKRTLMLPFSSFLNILPKLVRDLSRDQHKEAELALKGGEIEIDKRILEEMKDPLIHLLRNCIDHGIEKPEARKHREKLPTGIIIIAISQVDSNKVEIIISDDGAGIDVAKVKEAAAKRGIISKTEAENLNEEDALSLIFQSELSTSSIVTDISGRGLGLAIVREKVEKLGGTISLQTKPYIGTTFRILLPLTLATFKGILVRTADHLFVVPLSNVEIALRIKRDEIKSVENRETISLNGRPLSIVRLDDVLELPRKVKKAESSGFVKAIVLSSAEKLIAFIVDEVIEEQEVLVKKLGRQLTRVRNIGGAAVLRSGQVVPVLNVHDLLISAVKITGAPVSRVPVSEEKAEEKRILIAEDSIISRMLLKHILESAGYAVRTVVDGVEALTALKEGDYDLIVSDVDMPRMNGFDLTARVRSDKNLSDMPLVLVTALSSKEDREQGIKVGANAYIVKSSFDQSNLLEIIKRLI